MLRGVKAELHAFLIFTLDRGKLFVPTRPHSDGKIPGTQMRGVLVCFGAGMIFVENEESSDIYPTRCNVTQFIYEYIRKLLYMFRVVLPPIIRSAYNCVYSIRYVIPLLL